jgi:hypothetical protein
MNKSRIPEFADKSFDGMQAWFASMSEHELLFHPDDLPKDIIVITTGEPTFSPGECKKTTAILETMFELHGDNVYEAAYPVFMKCMGLRLDS